MTILSEQAKEILYDERDDWEALHDTETIISHHRGLAYCSKVFLYKPTDQHYKMYYYESMEEYAEDFTDEFKTPEIQLEPVEWREVTKFEWTTPAIF